MLNNLKRVIALILVISITSVNFVHADTKIEDSKTYKSSFEKLGVLDLYSDDIEVKDSTALDYDTNKYVKVVEFNNETSLFLEYNCRELQVESIFDNKTGLLYQIDYRQSDDICVIDVNKLIEDSTVVSRTENILQRTVNSGSGRTSTVGYLAYTIRDEYSNAYIRDTLLYVRGVQTEYIDTINLNGTFNTIATLTTTLAALLGQWYWTTLILSPFAAEMFSAYGTFSDFLYFEGMIFTFKTKIVDWTGDDTGLGLRGSFSGEERICLDILGFDITRYFGNYYDIDSIRDRNTYFGIMAYALSIGRDAGYLTGWNVIY